MKKIRISFNQNTCIGCGACQIACKERNGLMEGEFIRRVTLCSRQTKDGLIRYPYSFSCNHCDNPKCTAVCPTGAMHKSPDGTVLHDDRLCIACGRCYWACPFGEISFSKTTGMTQKCDNCISLQKEGKLPKCVSFCPTHSLELVKEEVEDLPVPEADVKKDRKGRLYLILGSGAAGVYAAKAIREEDSDARIIMLSDDSHRPYRRPLLSKSPFRTFRKESLELFDENWFLENDVELHLNERVISLIPDEKTVVTEAGRYRYDKCIYCLGASAFVPPFPGRDKNGVCSVRTIEDIEKIKHLCLKGDEAVIIGGGVIGIEFAQELQYYGLNVTILEAMPRLMARQLDEDMSARIQKKLIGIGIRVETGVSIKQISGDGSADGVELSDGRFFPASLVIVSCGVKANIKIAQDAGISCGRAVIVNEYMETNVDDIWACGDVAELNGRNYALWSQAMIEGTTAGRNAAGKHVEVEEFDTSLILNNKDISFFSAGDIGSDENKDYLKITSRIIREGFLINDREMESFTKMVYSEGRLTGCAVLGNLSEMENLRKSLKEEI